jgi:hypothetical protein
MRDVILIIPALGTGDHGVRPSRADAQRLFHPGSVQPFQVQRMKRPAGADIRSLRPLHQSPAIGQLPLFADVRIALRGASCPIASSYAPATRGSASRFLFCGPRD